MLACSISLLPYSEIQCSIQQFASLGLTVQLTELDVSMYAWEEQHLRFPNPPLERQETQAERYKQIFRLLRAHKDKVSGVTFWGFSDKSTWLDNFPVEDRKDWPLLFDAEKKPKKSFHAITNSGMQDVNMFCW